MTTMRRTFNWQRSVSIPAAIADGERGGLGFKGDTLPAKTQVRGWSATPGRLWHEAGSDSAEVFEKTEAYRSDRMQPDRLRASAGASAHEAAAMSMTPGLGLHPSLTFRDWRRGRAATAARRSGVW